MRSRRSRLLLPVVLVGLAAALGTAAGAGTLGPLEEARKTARLEADANARAARLAAARESRALVREIRTHRYETWRWQFVMGKRRTPYAGHAERSASLPYKRWARATWEQRAKKARRTAKRPPHYDEWLCIHRYEGAWNDPNAPYYGGLQMDMSFQRAYGPHLVRAKGTADNWTPLEQMWVAEKAHASGRGFHPWPNTARFCGLI
jgi:hypothetical protein